MLNLSCWLVMGLIVYFYGSEEYSPLEPVCKVELGPKCIFLSWYQGKPSIILILCLLDASPHVILCTFQTSSSEFAGVLNLPNQLVITVIVTLYGLGPLGQITPEIAFGFVLGLKPIFSSQRVSCRNMKTLPFVVFCLQFIDVLSQMFNINFKLFFYL